MEDPLQPWNLPTVQRAWRSNNNKDKQVKTDRTRDASGQRISQKTDAAKTLETEKEGTLKDAFHRQRGGRPNEPRSARVEEKSYR